MSKFTPSSLGSLQNETSAIANINSNMQKLKEAFDNTLSRDGATPNQMGADLDMNSNKIINIADGTSNSDAASFGQLAPVLTQLEALDAAVDSAHASDLSAQVHEAGAAVSASNALTSETNAAVSETNAAASDASAAVHDSNAAASDASAATHASNAATSEINAAASDASAATHDSNSATHDTNAATSASNAATSETNAATSETNAAASFSAFDTQYLGAKAVAPTLDNEGNALVVGALYFNTSSSLMNVWDGSIWKELETGEATFIGSVVEDTTPQLGGDLDLNGHVITGMVIGTDIQAPATTLSGYGITDGQPLDAGLTDISGLSPSSNNFIVGNGTNWALNNPSTVKNVLSLENVDNTSDATKNSASATLTNKTINSANNTITTVSDIILVIGNGVSTITTGIAGSISVDFTGTITGWTLLANASGSIVVDLWKDTYANYPPTVADTITASAKPTISSATKATSTTLTGWTTTLSAGDVIRVNVDSITTCKQVTLVLQVSKTL